ncbi:MCE family protein [Actinospongicola halichondriae]|uniref:MCE family protein n=1 Tax=Actinospongicola halichondriae TaxID=3236844 RepID=UPI003D56B0A0
MTRTAIKFGMFVALCMVFLVYLASTIGNTTALGLIGQGPDTYSVSATFDDVSGLLLGDNVKVAGVPIGKVTDITVESGRANVKMQIDADRKVPADSSATIRWRNLIGQRYVYLVPGDAPAALADGDVIEDTTNVIDLGELFNRLGPIVATIDSNQVNDFLDTVTTALEGNEMSVSEALDDLAFVVQGLGERDAAIGRLIENLEVVARTVADRDSQIETMLDNLAALSQTFSDNTALLETAILEIGAFNTDLSSVLAANRSEIDGLLASLDATLNTVEDQLGPLDLALDRLDENASATFRSSRDGTFLNQAILCLTVLPPPCTTPTYPGLDALLGDVVGTSGADPVVSGSSNPSRIPRLQGSEAVTSLVGGGAR